MQVLQGSAVGPVVRPRFPERINAEIAQIGGAGENEIHISNRWVRNANFILQWAINENKKGNVFPIWGTCLGL